MVMATSTKLKALMIFTVGLVLTVFAPVGRQRECRSGPGCAPHAGRVGCAHAEKAELHRRLATQKRIAAEAADRRVRVGSGSGVSRSCRRATRRMRQASDVADLSGAQTALQAPCRTAGRVMCVSLCIARLGRCVLHVSLNRRRLH